MEMVLISGGTGMIGNKLTDYLISKGYEVTILSRERDKVSSRAKLAYSYWNVEKKIIDSEVVKKAHHIIHLAGAGVMDKKWSKEYRQKILDSRVKSAELIISTLRGANHNVKTFVSASAIGWYGPDAQIPSVSPFVETDLPSPGFLGATCVRWEAAADEATDLGIRTVKLRTGIVLSNNGGALDEFKKPLRFGIAPILGNGKQVISWIHLDDLCRMYGEAIGNQYLSGSYNAVAPDPVNQKTLELVLAKKVRNKFFTTFHVPVFILKLLLGERSIEILKSATVNCKKIKATGFTFLYPSIEAAVNELVAKENK